MYAIIKNGQVIDIINNPKFLFKNISFPKSGISDDFLQSHGIFKIIEGEQKDERFYTVEKADPFVKIIDGVPYSFYKNTPKDLDEIKQKYVNETKQRAKGVLSETDWYFTRKEELGINVPQEVLDYRANIRNIQSTRETSILNSTTVDEIKEIVYPTPKY